jgi:RimJ/RimL family protein N-acetyltransferase
VAELPTAQRLHTSRLVLDPLRVGDAQEMVRVLADPGLYRFIGGGPPTLDQLRARYTRQVRGRSPDGHERWCNWLLRLANSGAEIGAVQATVGREAAELAWVVSPAHQRRGYATEAAAALARWLAGCGVTRLIAHINPAHAASIGVARALGMSPTATVIDGELRWELRPAQPGCMPPSSGST